jgi:hypothetical protein
VPRNRIAHYALSLPERLLRSASGLAAGLLRELSDVAVPAAVRRTRLYQNLVDNTLRFMIEQVGEVEGAYPEGAKLAEDFALRRAAGNGIEFVGILAFRASPVWIMAALADLSGAGRHLIREIAAELKQNHLLELGTNFETVDQLLDGLERFSTNAAGAINTPPLDIGELRNDWLALRKEAIALPTPAVESIEKLWRELNQEAVQQNRSVFALSSLLALSALTSAPGAFLWLSRSATLAARRTGVLLGEALLGHYSRTLGEIHQTGFLNYWVREYKPYLRAAAEQFSPARRSSTEKFLER